MSAEENLKKLGLTLPTIPTPVGTYVPWKRDGNTIYLSGQGPRDKDGKHITGLVGKDVTIEQGYEYAKLVGMRTTCRGKGLRGTAISWETHAFPRSSAFVVELPPGRVSGGTADRQARGVLTVAEGR